MIAVAPATSLKFSPSLETNRKLCPPQRLSMRSSIQRRSSQPLTETIFFSHGHGFNPAARRSRTMALALARNQFRCSVVTIKRPCCKTKKCLKIKKKRKTIALPQLDDGGNGGWIGGDDGFVGGGGNGDDDNDDYMFDDDNEENDEDKGLFRRRLLVPESFDKASIDAVLSEWMRKVADLPTGLRLAVELRLVSSAELTRFLRLNSRPSPTRLFARLLSHRLSWDFQAKLMADPALPQKLFWEAFSSAAWSLWLDLKDDYYNPGEESIEYYWTRFRERPRALLANAAANAAFSAFAVTTFAPSSHLVGLGNLPNNVFQQSNRLRVFGPRERLLSFFLKAVPLFAFGSAAKAANAVIRLPKSSTTAGGSCKTLSTVSKQALSAGLSLGLLTNLRYQLICGTDRAVDLYFDSKQVSLAFCFALRFLNVGYGISRSPSWVDQSDDQRF